MDYATARTKADEMTADSRDSVCLVVNADRTWDAMWFSEWMGSHIPHVRMGWVSSNSRKANERLFRQAVQWMETQR
jgi:hypothetical protein